MKTAIIYNSQTGFTRKYAEWISKAVGAECFKLGIAKKQNFDTYNSIVFGSWICAGNISKLEWFKSNIDKWSGKTVIVFCTGSKSPNEHPEIETSLRKLFNEDEQAKIHVFYCPGGFNYKKLSIGSKLMMKIFRKMLDKKKDKTEEEIQMIKMISRPCDISDKKYIEPIVQLLRKSELDK